MRHVLIALALLAGMLFAATSQAANAPKQWTFLVYLNGDNSLDSYGAFNINQMEQVGSTDRINIVVQWASTQAGGTKRLLIKKDNDTNNVTSPVVQDMGVVDMGDYNSLVDFVKWGAANYPAEHYFVDVWDHGGGWHIQTLGLANPFDNGPGSINPMDISWDDGSGHFITTKQLGTAINESAKIIGHKVDLYGSDACLMAMPEVANEMADSVSVFAGSEETEPAAGWPYDVLLQKWDAINNATPAQVATILTDAYVASYQGGENGNSEATFSAFDMTKLGDLNKSVQSLSSNLSALDNGQKQKILDAINNTVTFAYSDYGDLGNFVNNLGSLNIVRDDVVAEVNSAVSGFVIDNKVTPRYAKATGVSIWLPADSSTFSSYWDKYKDLVFQQVTHWGDALKAVLAK